MPLCFFNHPFFLAAAAVVAIGVVVYEIVTSQEENRMRQRRDRRRKSPPPSPPDSPKPPKPRPRPPQPDSLGYSEPSLPPKNNENSSDSQVVPYSKSPDNNLRKRNVDQTSPKVSSSADFKHETVTPPVAVRVEDHPLPQSETSPTRNNQDIPDKFDENNYCKNVLDNLNNDKKNINENTSMHNIYKEDSSDSSEDNLLPKAEEKVINQIDENVRSSDKPLKCKKKSKNAVQSHVDNKPNKCFVYSSSDSQSDVSESSFPKNTKRKHVSRHTHYKHDGAVSKNITDQRSKSSSSNSKSSSSSSDEGASYKRKVYKALKYGTHDNEIKKPGCSSTSSSENIKKDNLSKSNICQACEINHINTRAYPCGHSYLCVECAVKLSRVYKKCSICHEDAEFLQISL